MPTRKVKARVQSHCRTRAGNLDRIRYLEEAMCAVDFDPNNFFEGQNVPMKKPEGRGKANEKQASFAFGGSSNDSSDEAIYEESDEEIEPEQLSITKQSVSTIEEQNCKGRLTSSLGAAIVASRPSPSTLQSFPPIEDDEDEDPSPSLIIETPVDFPQGEARQEVQSSRMQAQLKRALPKPDIKPSPRTYLQTVVELFAGRKKTAWITPAKDLGENEPIYDESRLGVESEDEAQAASDRSSYTSAEPRLTLAEVIPDGRPRKSGLFPPPSKYLEILPPKREHRLTGYAVIQPDKFTPEQVQRGFKTTHKEASITPSVTVTVSPLAYRAHKQGNSAANLLDRDTKTWASWHSKNPVSGKMPFAKQPLCEADLNQVQSDDTSRGNGAELTPCYLKHTGDAYPYAQGKCW
ncbi:hypothetical protein J1614_012006 [Plenodomus biglobosus]|nr:hypothetical protein J1614_012006 [Plenodomus biglobosus]